MIKILLLFVNSRSINLRQRKLGINSLEEVEIWYASYTVSEIYGLFAYLPQIE